MKIIDTSSSSSSYSTVVYTPSTLASSQVANSSAQVANSSSWVTYDELLTNVNKCSALPLNFNHIVADYARSPDDFVSTIIRTACKENRQLTAEEINNLRTYGPQATFLDLRFSVNVQGLNSNARVYPVINGPLVRQLSEIGFLNLSNITEINASEIYYHLGPGCHFPGLKKLTLENSILMLPDVLYYPALESLSLRNASAFIPRNYFRCSDIRTLIELRACLLENSDDPPTISQLDIQGILVIQMTELNHLDDAVLNSETIERDGCVHINMTHCRPLS